MDYRQPYHQWEVKPPLSLVDLVANGTMDLRTASLLWLAVERKASIISAARPRLAGKTALLVALREMAPPSLDRVYTRGVEEDFSFVHDSDPRRTYIMVNELSDHLPYYLSGWRVQRVFELLGQGYSLMATMHADTAEEVFQQLADEPNRVPAALLGKLHLLVLLAIAPGAEGTKRRVHRVELVVSGRSFPSTLEVARWEPRSDTFTHTDEGRVLEALAERFGVGGEARVKAMLEEHRAFLDELLRQGVTDVERVRERVLAFYKGLEQR